MTTSNFNKTLFFMLSVLAWHSAFTQRATRHFIDSILFQKDTGFFTAKKLMYVVNGVPYEAFILDSVLGNFETKHLLDAVYWNGSKHGAYPFYGDAAIIVFAHNQKMKSKRKAWKAANKLFNDIFNPPVLLIDNSVIDPKISKSTFRGLRLNEILYIDRIRLGNENHIRIWKFH